jgi:hypothetical protein
MPRYLIVRKFEVDGDEMPQVGRRSRVAIEDNFPDIVGEHSRFVVDDAGLVRTYCVYEAPDMDTVRDHSRVLGQHQLETIQEIAGDVTPADFPG